MFHVATIVNRAVVTIPGASTAGGQAIQNLVITGSLITIIPLVIAFLCLQKYWQSGLAAGAVKE